MLTSSLKQFQKNINDLRNFIEIGIIKEQEYFSGYLRGDDSQEADINQDFESFLANYTSTNSFRKIVNYNAVVVMLYGYLERYMESVAKEYLENLVRLTDSYNMLPERIKENHFNKSIELLQNIKKYEKYIKNMDINSTIKTGYRVLSKTITTNQYRQVKIVSIQENGKTIEEIKTDGQSKKIGIKVDFKIKDNQEFYLIQN